PEWFSEIEGDMTLENDGRWVRVIRLGDSALVHHQTHAYSIDHLGKSIKQEHSEPNPQKNDYYGAIGGFHRYRFKAGPNGVSFQVDDEKAISMPGPWQGGRLKWGGHNNALPGSLKIIGRC